MHMLLMNSIVKPTRTLPHANKCKYALTVLRQVHIETRLLQLGITLPPQPVPKGNYINFVQTGNLVYIAGSLPQPINAPLITGRLGENMNIEQGKHAARLAGLNMIATLQIACGGNLDKVRRIVKIVGYVNSTLDFTSQATVMNGCSDLFGEVFQEKGRHARSAIGTSKKSIDLYILVQYTYILIYLSLILVYVQYVE